jgi:preprotein translocase subunit SecG
MLFGFLTVIFVIVCIILCFLILIQSDKGGGISGALGGGLGGASNLFGAQDTANFLTRFTAIFGGAFLTLCVLMAFVMHTSGVSQSKSLLQERAKQQKGYDPSSALPKNNSIPFDNGATAPAGDAQPSLPVVPPVTK